MLHMDDDRQAYEFAYALHLARQVDRKAAQMIVAAAEAGVIGIDRQTQVLRLTCYGANKITMRGHPDRNATI